MVQQLEGAEAAAFIEEMTPQVITLKKTASGRQITVLDRLMTISTDPSRDAGTSRPKIATPTTPGLRIDVNSAAPTPALTTEHNSPESCGPPSTIPSTSDEAVADSGKAGAVTSVNGQPQVLVDADEGER
jgi:mRNA-binding protein PUF3